MFQEMPIGSKDESVSTYSWSVNTYEASQSMAPSEAADRCARQTPNPQATASSGTHSCPVDGGSTKLGIHTRNAFKFNEGSGDHVR